MKCALLSRTAELWSLALIVTVIAGCGSGRSLVLVEGQVTLDGKPLSDASVMFLPTEKGPSAYGVTNSDGHFKLTTVNDAGAMRGSYQVAIAKRKYVPPKPGQPAPPGGLVAEWYSPTQFANPDTSGLTAHVGDGANDFKFEISSAPSK